MSDVKQNTKKNISELERKLRVQKHEYRYQHDHKDPKGPTITPVKDASGYIANRHLYSDTTVICEECGEIFDMQSKSEDDFAEAVFTIKSMVNQMKILTNFNSDNGDAVRESLAVILKFIDNIEMNFGPSYFKMIKQFSGGNKNKNKNGNQRQKGHMGVSSSSFGR